MTLEDARILRRSDPDMYLKRSLAAMGAHVTAMLEFQRAGSVVFDYGQGFETDTLDRQFRKYTRSQEYLIGEKGLAINPLEIFPKDVRGPNTVATRVADVFDAVYRLGDIQR